MNPWRAAFCRMYQGAFRAALPVLPYRMPRELGAVTEIPETLSGLGISSALLVTDPSIRSLGLTAPLEEAMDRAGIDCPVYDGALPNPTFSMIEEALKLYQAHGCGAVIGFGGGSAMDCAKATAARAGCPGRSLKSMSGNLRILHRLPPIFAVPTTAGTGSETTLAAVITDDVTRHKVPMNDFNLIPSYAVLDPESTVGLPKSITATTGMDALTHAVEAYIGRSTTKETRAWSIEAIQLIVTYLERAYTDGSDLEARRQMLRAAYLAGASFTRSYVGYCHAVAHSLGGMYNTPHGLANAVLLPYVLKAYGDSVYKKLKELAVAIGLCGPDAPASVASELFIRKIERMNRNMGIPTKLSGIHREDIYQLSKYADHEGNPLYPVPKLMDRKALEQFYVLVAEDLGEETNTTQGQTIPGGSKEDLWKQSKSAAS